MSRSGYSDDIDDNWQLIRYRGRVASAVRGKRGQTFFRDLLAALDALPEKRLIANDLIKDGEVCAIGALGKARGVDMTALDPDDPQGVAGVFNIAECLACEVVYFNDEIGWRETPEERFARMRKWVSEQLRADTSAAP